MESKTVGILLAGGKGTRLYPLTKNTSKQLLSIYNKPLIYYPLSTLMLSGIRKILIISTKEDINNYRSLLGDGSELGCEFQYKIQEKPDGIGSAFILGEKFIGNNNVFLILGDNIFHGDEFMKSLRESINDSNPNTIFGYYVQNPNEYGVIKFKNKKIVDIIEKPSNYVSNYAVPGIYLYDNSVVNVAKSIGFSERGEREITDINRYYLSNNELSYKLISRGTSWLDTGTFQNMNIASNYVMTLEDRQGLMIGSIEEIAFRMNYINKKEYLDIIDLMPKCEYKNKLLTSIDN